MVRSDEYMIDGWQVNIEPNADRYSPFRVQWSVSNDEGIQAEGLAVSNDSADLQAGEAIKQLQQQEG